MKKSLAVALLSLVLGSPAWSAVNINTASEAELEAVRGIGPGKAKAIVAHRQKNGNFKSLEELEQVKGFGPASVKRLNGLLSVTATPTPAATKPAATK